MVRMIHVLISASFWRGTLDALLPPNNSLTETVKSASQVDSKALKNKKIEIYYSFFFLKWPKFLLTLAIAIQDDDGHFTLPCCF